MFSVVSVHPSVLTKFEICSVCGKIRAIMNSMGNDIHSMLSLARLLLVNSRYFVAFSGFSIYCMLH